MVYKARESHVVAEQELLPSTSSHVREIWNGCQVVRVIDTFGRGKDMRNLLVGRDGRVFNPNVGFKNGLIDTKMCPGRDSTYRMEVVSITPSNITLNTHNSTISSREIHLWVMVAIFLQAATTVYPMIMMMSSGRL